MYKIPVEFSVDLVAKHLAAEGRPPDQVRNCSVTNYTSDSLRIECEEGYDGGLQQKFYLEVYNEAQEYLEKNLTRLEPVFNVQDITASTEYILVIYAANMKGRSPSVVIKGSTEAAPRSEQGFSSESINIILGVMIGVVAALVFVAGIAVFIIRMREEEREAGSREGPAREKDEILLKKNLVDPSEHDGKDPDVIPPQNSYCAEMEQPGGIPNMLLPPNDYIGPEERANYRIEAVQEMPFDPVPQKSGLYEAGFTGSLQRNPKHRQEAYIDFCPNQPVVAPNICQYDANAVPFATLDYHRRPPQAMVGGVMSHPELEDERRTLPRVLYRNGISMSCKRKTLTRRCTRPLVVEGQQFRRQFDVRLFQPKKHLKKVSTILIDCLSKEKPVFVYFHSEIS
ncbi:uncharacterized protein TNIN_414411 [Trichonephila inaurata madagascariensis]|uniref:Fibronectin type-III domain-containing protein n=1 Tax=Trichonephila inaurata madagascariensis TaxID=2747483 RepID=A0A8X7CD33_9ARAC|nr:uncharacterized protein TNIN_414411 [Trichonephila inaurata madagascariensis]